MSRRFITLEEFAITVGVEVSDNNNACVLKTGDCNEEVLKAVVLVAVGGRRASPSPNKRFWVRESMVGRSLIAREH